MQGKYMTEKSLPYHTTRVLPVSDNYLMYCDYIKNWKLEEKNACPNVILTTAQGKVLSSVDYYSKNTDPSIVWSSNPDLFCCGEGIVSIKPDHCNIIYHATADSIFPAYRLDFGKYSLNYRYWNEATKHGTTLQKVNDFCDYNGFCDCYRMLEDRDFLFLKYKFKGKINSVFYSKKTGKTLNIRLFKNDIDDITAFYPILLKDRKMYCLLKVEDVLTAKKYLEENKLLPASILKSVKEFDNPIITVFTLRDF
jgi:hypothetical protein